ncbi:MAG: zinc ribbon domain-containing protein [Deltaproteobacteria bacterium]|nr:zinc ribbon domain-containing protein [Deltaproteobacteria bacterium]MBW2051433.1 zinc ribbon domain-containing protein [Deltaproteobacteria bacterium]MBW2140892.1 zinc ribbon domain-containing protein [Deltaproteobacteria bacterium]MBW2323349.1 zinc ribbon domain-containing protein [Deltaproteobacteria bacterium]
MPIYEYHCDKCNEDFEKLVFSTSEEIACPKCDNKKVEKLMSGFSHKSGENFNSSLGSSCTGCSSTDCGSCH